ncbi:MULTISPECIES: sugar ABC transporter substrate-binding protein [Burkholderia cepacia complex]|uniref:sugar ABC transporter substrate-binding protein n=1 Tax=Burkholderia cepacia complex TaxID=87882 RepID=UPI001B9BD464|nr:MULTISPECIES: sugar ABC transporter substrate-binding protein [Burkholderia cepacia complex]MBR8408547.1 sugar ABC transporter substrate-binding protein [Burkholderia cenocepacia]MDN7646249.1 sugar ABC transporter substrate-binding protein [Burkholderia cenocepacia]WJN72922.1 Ribose ABC transporter, periplasmic ribose-binding protein RbsB [Burkholderia anthina]
MKVARRALAVAAVLAFGITAPVHSQAKAKIYTLLPNTALSGVVDPALPDRTAVRKAWPKQPANPNQLKIGWTDITLGNPWFVELIKGARQSAAKYGYSIDVQVADGDLQRQCAQIDNFVTRKMDVIVVDPTDTLGVSACINRAVDTGIPVVTVGTTPDASARVLTTLLGNPYASGFEVGRYVAKEAGKDTPIDAAVVIGVLGNSTSESRINGLIAGIVDQRMRERNTSASREDAMLRGFELFQTLKKTGKLSAPDIKFNVLALGVGKWTEEGSLAATEDILSAHGSKLNFILSENDFMGLGALRAVRNMGKQGKIRIADAAGGYRGELDQIKKGNILVSGENSGEQTGVAAIEFIHNAFTRRVDANNLPMGSGFPPAIITQDNVDQKIDPNPANLFYKYTIPPVRSISEIRAQGASN